MVLSVTMVSVVVVTAGDSDDVGVGGGDAGDDVGGSGGASAMESERMTERREKLKNWWARMAERAERRKVAGPRLRVRHEKGDEGLWF